MSSSGGSEIKRSFCSVNEAIKSQFQKGTYQRQKLLASDYPGLGCYNIHAPKETVQLMINCRACVCAAIRLWLVKECIHEKLILSHSCSSQGSTQADHIRER